MIPVFVGGHPRSGTTLLGSMIGAHSKCICTPESQFKTRALRQSSRGDRVDIRTAFHLIKADWRFKIWSLDIDSVPYDELHSHQDLILRIVKAYGEKFGKPDAGIWVDHTPSNVKNAATLLELFPGAKFIHIVRDGRAVASSIMPLDWGANTINSAARSWVKRLSQYLAAESSLGSERISRVRFEDLVLEPETTLKSICSFLDIIINSNGERRRQRCLNIRQTTLLIGKDPIRRGSEKKELTPGQMRSLSTAGGARLGYGLRWFD
jgi:hypothetical protein